MKVFENEINLDLIKPSKSEETFNELVKIKENVDRLEYFFHIELLKVKQNNNKKIGLFLEEVLNEDITPLSIALKRFLSGLLDITDKENNDLISFIKIIYKKYEDSLNKVFIPDSYIGWLKERDNLENIDMGNMKF
jgi:hypothetical protein